MAILELVRFQRLGSGHIFRTARYSSATTPCRVVMERIHGKPMDRILARSGRFMACPASRVLSEELVELAGNWLGYFHNWPSNGVAACLNIEATRKRALEEIEYLVGAGLPEAQACGCRESIERESQLDIPPLVATLHGDFKPANLMVAGDQVVGIDLEAYYRGHPAIDIGQFIAHLFLLRSAAFPGSGQPSWWRHLASRFLRGYAAVSRLDLAGLELRVIASILSALVTLASHHKGPFWLLRGRPMMIRTIRDILNRPVIEAIPNG